MFVFAMLSAKRTCALLFAADQRSPTTCMRGWVASPNAASVFLLHVISSAQDLTRRNQLARQDADISEKPEKADRLPFAPVCR